MTQQLKVELGQYSHQGRKVINQDFYAASIPQNYVLQHKGIACALSDGISSSNVSHIASQMAVTGLLADYFSTPETWTVKTSVQRVLTAVNSWLYAQTQQSQYRFDKDRGYVCTLSALVMKGHIVHLFHIGDSRIYRLQSGQLEQLSTDHRVWLSSQESYLSRALGVNPKVDIDYQSYVLYENDIFILMTDGVYEYCSSEKLTQFLTQTHTSLDLIAQQIVEYAYQQGSIDNLTIQIVKVQELPQVGAHEIVPDYTQLAFVPSLNVPTQFDGYQIVREIHNSNRSVLYLAHEIDQQQLLVIKVPATDVQQDPYLTEQFLFEEWIANRIHHPHVLAAYVQLRPRNYIYHTMEYIEGVTLKQWITDQQQLVPLDKVRQIIEQIAKGLQAIHRLEMIHQDIRPENIMIDHLGTVKIIDFGACRVAGIREMTKDVEEVALGTMAYMAPEYFLSESVTASSDQYSLGVLAYYLLSADLPYQTNIAKCKSKKDFRKLQYRSLSYYREDVPLWVDKALERAVQIRADHRYDDVAEFVYDLIYPNPKFLTLKRKSWVDRDPVMFWKAISSLLFLLLLGGVALVSHFNTIHF
ncbi:bifunctional protein-serine/threonine kinase/phosphatase [Acinetobacter rongchengensis]|uniref:Bifunctional protein-serine/threonine kinase/phosphatase n=1 Tax=Acinetobacter rongchengensis TaxID=2419601 RepID=A0A3A8EYP1_9GAMM|nr:bifunctional protein-serine/threonine kinase/phosphatase [Acinetobacter rongchengensis]RKG39288.1 bifunctional protein-serine/threonine kinase/phosphatase [Acinetobacter rongchengensis]